MLGILAFFATNGAEAPNHICEMKCADANAARDLTAEARSAGLTIGIDKHFHSGI